MRAMEIIRQLEARPRGLYTGALGWIGPDRTLSLNVAIRTLVLDPAGRGRLGIGSGIVADSDTEAELAECRAKARFLTDLPPPFCLIETLYLEGAGPEPYPLLRRHLERLAASGALFGFRLDLERVRRQLLQHGRDQGPGRFRTRLLLAADGGLEIASSALAPLPPGPVEVRLARRRLGSDDLLLRHKTSVRGALDADLAALPPGVFDCLYLNQRGELCQGARTNLYLQLEGRLYTPPLACGLLDGVMRRELLAQGRALERVLYARDLEAAEALFVSNALRGLLPARLGQQG
jgi:para-aminobenzoate synthetase/4-amino-4-deoxychorismate lyase